jgi:hypothetical protein
MQNDDDGHDTELDAPTLVGPDHPVPANVADGARSALTMTATTATALPLNVVSCALRTRQAFGTE